MPSSLVLSPRPTWTRESFCEMNPEPLCIRPIIYDIHSRIRPTGRRAIRELDRAVAIDPEITAALYNLSEVSSRIHNGARFATNHTKTLWT